MIGNGIKYSFLQRKPFNFPEKISRIDNEIINERHFLEFLLRNDWVQRKIGIKMAESNGLFPDIKGEIYDRYGGLIRIEVEFWAENYKLHKHGYKACDLILSYFRTPEVNFVQGIPVWSFYKGYKEDDIYQFCLNEDISKNFNEMEEEGVYYSIDKVNFPMKNDFKDQYNYEKALGNYIKYKSKEWSMKNDTP